MQEKPSSLRLKDQYERMKQSILVNKNDMLNEKVLKMNREKAYDRKVGRNQKVDDISSLLSSEIVQIRG